MLLMTALFVNAKYWKQSKFQDIGEWLNTLQPTSTVEYCALVKRNEEDLYELFWSDL